MAALSVAGAKRVAARRGAWIVFADECGQTLRPLKASTWAPRGVTPIVVVTAAGNVRVSVAGLVCCNCSGHAETGAEAPDQQRRRLAPTGE